MVIDMTDPVHRVRLAIGDISDTPLLTNDVIQYYLDTNSQNEVVAIKQAASNILVLLSYGTRERLDRVEVYGNQAFEQYLKVLKEVINNPSSASNPAGIYGTGVFIDDIKANQADSSVIQNRIPINPIEITNQDGQYADIQDTTNLWRA